MKYNQKHDNPLILGPHLKAEIFNQQTLADGGLLDLSLCSDEVQIEFYPAASRIDSRLELWRSRPDCQMYFNNLYTGFIVNPSVNAYAYQDDKQNVLAINSGLVWLLHELWFTFFSHPDFLNLIAGEKTNPPFCTLQKGFSSNQGIVGETSDRIIWRSHPRPFNDFRLLLSLVMSQMSIEFVFLHELGHLIQGHSAFLRLNDPSFRFNELESSRRSSGIDAKLFQAIEYDADGFAIQASLSNRIMLDYFEQHLEHKLGIGESSPKEMAFYFWAMAISGVMRLFSQQGLAISQHQSSTHPHPLLRAIAITFTAATSTALKDDPDKERIINLCCRASLDLADYWHKFQIPGYQYDPVADENLMMESATSLHSAGQVLKNTGYERTRYVEEKIDKVICNGAKVDMKRNRPNKLLKSDPE